MNDVRYFQSYKTIWHTNETSGHVWYEYVSVNKWEVHGAFLPVSYHRTEKAAEEECNRRLRLPKYTPPVGKRTGK